MASQHDIITIQNITSEDFKFEYDRAAGNYPYIIKAGEIKRFPRFLAKHAVKKLIDKVLTDQEIRTNNLVARQQVAEKIIVEEETFQQKPRASKADRLQRRVEKLNAPSELDAILKRRKKKLKTADKLKQPPKPVKPREEEFEGLKEKKAKPELPPKSVKPSKAPKPAPKVEAKPKGKDETAITLPTRQKLYDYMAKEKGIELTKQVAKDFDTLDIKTLIKDFNYPLLEK